MDKLKFLLIFNLLLWVIPCLGQKIKSKDGVLLGERNEFISSCTNSIDNKLMTINGIEIESLKFCSCVCDKIMPTINSWELKKAFKENKMSELFMKDRNLEIIMNCIDGKYKINDDFKYEKLDNPELQNKIGVKNCIYELMQDSINRKIWTKELAKNYCECAINKLLTGGYTYKDIQQIQSESSLTLNEITVPCMTEIMKSNKTHIPTNNYNKNDIKGSSSKCEIPLTDFLGKGFKVKISINGLSKYYLFDTGASDLIINSETEKELLLNGILKKENYLNKEEFKLANNQTVIGQKIKVDNIAIGDYTLTNVIIVIIDESNLLCGNSFLDKFKNWEFDKQNKMLILYK